MNRFFIPKASPLSVINKKTPKSKIRNREIIKGKENIQALLLALVSESLDDLFIERIYRHSYWDYSATDNKKTLQSTIKKISTIPAYLERVEASIEAVHNLENLHIFLKDFAAHLHEPVTYRKIYVQEEDVSEKRCVCLSIKYHDDDHGYGGGFSVNMGYRFFFHDGQLCVFQFEFG